MQSTLIKIILACKALCLIPTWYTKIEIVFLPLCYLHRCTRRYFFNSALEQTTNTRGYCFLAALGTEGPSSSMGHLFSEASLCSLQFVYAFAVSPDLSYGNVLEVYVPPSFFP